MIDEVMVGHADSGCPSLDHVRMATCLSDLLFDSPAEWDDTPALMHRDPGGGWKTLIRAEVKIRVLRVAIWLQQIGIQAGDHIGILGHNSIEWFLADFAILRLGAVTVPAYFTDPPEAVQYVFKNAECKLILVEPGEQQDKVKGMSIPVFPMRGEGKLNLAAASRNPDLNGKLGPVESGRDRLATLIYTSGTTGHPKGVMLTHGNLLSDVEAGLGGICILPDDLFLSFLPVSHAFERTVGHFLPVASGAAIAYAEAVTTLMRDMPEVRPTVMISVPRLYEKIYAGVQEKLLQGPAIKRWLFARTQELGNRRFELEQKGRELAGLQAIAWRVLDHLVNAKLRDKMGGRLRLFVSGGAALNPAIARFLLAANIRVSPGYGLTETSPVLTVNPVSRIKPETVGPALPGVDLKLEADGELLVRGPMLMQGYWNRPKETAETFTKDGWLRTGDIAEIDDEGYVKIVDRKKEIMVLSNGENVPPALVEQLLAHDPCILQAMVAGEDKPYVSALIVPDQNGLKAAWRRDGRAALPRDWRQNTEVQTWLLKRIHTAAHDLASYMQVRKFSFVDDEWTQANGLLTPTLKFKRRKILEKYASEVAEMYSNQQQEDG